MTEVIARVHSVHLVNEERRQAAADPQTKLPTWAESQPGWALKTRPFTVCELPCRIWSFYAKRHECIQRSAEKLDPSRPPFQVTQDHRNRHGSIGFLWLRSHHWPISYRFLRKRWFWSKIAIFPLPTGLALSWRGFHLELCNSGEL